MTTFFRGETQHCKEVGNGKITRETFVMGSKMLVIGFGIGWLAGLMGDYSKTTCNTHNGNVSRDKPRRHSLEGKHNMEKKSETANSRHKTLIMVSSMLVTGFGIGWLMGLTVSPIAATVIATVSATGAAIVSTLSGIEDGPRLKVDPLPISIMIAGLVIGSLGGIWFRNEDFLARDISKEKMRWVSAGLALTEAEIVARLFDTEYPLASGQPGNGDLGPQGADTVLFAVSVKECDLLTTLQGDELRKEMLTSTNIKIQSLAEIISDPTVLKQVTRNVMCLNTD